jgi:CRISPR system Cascade subunit CasE
MHLSRLLLNPRSLEVRRDLSNVHNLHRRVLTAFEDLQREKARADYGVLFRVEASASGNMALLVQSAERPNWDRLPDGYLLGSFEINPAVTELSPLFASLRAGAKFKFRLRANPTKRLRTGSDAPGKRVELRGQEALAAWFARKAQEAGFGPARSASTEGQNSIWESSLLVQEEGKALGRRDGGRLTLASVLFEGELAVCDPEALQLALQRGIGSGKSYGFGLLSIAPS